MELFDKDKFRDKNELFAHLVEHKSSIISRKKSIMKQADGFGFISIGKDSKASKAIDSSSGNITASLVINTTKLLDSHKDVHLDGLWGKTLKEQPYINLNQEHKHGFRDIIADGADLKAYTQTFAWKELGFNFDGETQALMYDANITPKRNAYMFEQYKNGYVRNHSVEMYYVKMQMAINDPQYKEEYDVYNKYFDQIANKEDENEGYFFAIQEAKHVGGAAVTKGSNFATPVYNIEPSSDTQKDKPSNDTLTKGDIINIFKNYQNG